MGTSKNIIIGAAQIFLGPSVTDVTGADVNAKVTAWTPAVSGTTPYKTTVAAATPSLAAGGTGVWTDVGYTQEGVEVATDPSWTDVEVDQLLDAAKIFKEGMKLSVNTTFAEATLGNLMIAWGQRGTTLTSTATGASITMESGALGDAPVERGLIAVGNGPEKVGSNTYTERTYFAYRVLSVEGSTHKLDRATATTIPVSFRALPADNGRYGSVMDRYNVV